MRNILVGMALGALLVTLIFRLNSSNEILETTVLLPPSKSGIRNSIKKPVDQSKIEPSKGTYAVAENLISTQAVSPSKSNFKLNIKLGIIQIEHLEREAQNLREVLTIRKTSEGWHLEEIPENSILYGLGFRSEDQILEKQMQNYFSSKQELYDRFVTVMDKLSL